MDPSTDTTVRAMWVAACEKLSVARLLLENNHYNDCLSRAYYAAFHAASLVLFLSGKTFSRHSALIGAFNKEFIAPGVFPIAIGKALSSLFDARQSGDYDVFQPADEDEARKGVADTELILDTVREYCRTRYSITLPKLP